MSSLIRTVNLIRIKEVEIRGGELASKLVLAVHRAQLIHDFYIFILSELVSDIGGGRRHWRSPVR